MDRVETVRALGIRPSDILRQFTYSAVLGPKSADREVGEDVATEVSDQMPGAPDLSVDWDLEDVQASQ